MRRFFRLLALYAFHVGFVRPLVRWFLAARFRGLRHLPEGPCLVVANHNSHLDAAALMSLFPLGRIHRVHPVAAADYFGSNPVRRTLAMLLMNGIPIERRPKAGRDPLAPMLDALRAGESLIFFPEGSRGEAGVVAPFRPGIGRLLRSAPGLLVVPVFLSGPERIWPRGQVLPVPLSVDVNVGRPRSYSKDLDAREIAERVRDDVLALAPPPPPLPGPRPTPPVRIAVCGIDVESRRDVQRQLTGRFGGIARTLGLGRPMLEADGGEPSEASGPVPVLRSRAWLGLLAATFRTGGRFKGSRFAEMVERAAVDEALQHGRTARFLIGGGDAMVDLLAGAEADFYRGVFDEGGLRELMLYLSGERRIPFRRWWTFVRKAPEVWLLNTFDLVKLMSPDVVVLLRTAPENTMQRLRSLGRELAPFENEEFLGRLQEAYRSVSGVLERRRRVMVLEYDSEAVPVDEIVDAVERKRGQVLA